jgi:hypothetical protein
VHFQQSWSSHFGRTQSFEYGSSAEHAFDWSILLRNWDATVPAVVGIWILSRRLRKDRMAIVPLAWLAVSLVVFTIHWPWWAYYYIHVAIPLCWCAAVGIVFLCATVARRLVECGPVEGKRGGGFGRIGAKVTRGAFRVQGIAALGQVESGGMRRTPNASRNMSASVWFGGEGLRAFAGYAFVGLFGLCAVGWMGARVYLQIAGIRNSPQLYTALVLREIERLKPFSHWMYADPLVYSFHADIPVPPPLAVVSLKRRWTGDMTNPRIAAEMARYKPEVILLPNDTREVPFQEMLEADYRMIYQDEKLRLYAERAAIRQADSGQRSMVSGPRVGREHRTSNIQWRTLNLEP